MTRSIGGLPLRRVPGQGVVLAGGLVLATGAAWHALTHVVATGRRRPGPQPGPVERAVEHLRATTPHRTSVESLAAMVGLSASQFGALFREQVGTSPLRYQTRLRMARARELLDSTTMTVAAVSAAVGYDDPLYFSRQFSRTHGVSPTTYRGRVGEFGTTQWRRDQRHGGDLDDQASDSLTP